MIPVLVFFVAHWQLSVFFQTFFLHRYGAHQQFTMTKGWERFFFFLTYLAQGWVVGTEGFSPTMSNAIVLAWVLGLAWMTWLALVARNERSIP